ncbi:hypothetical protein Ae201684_010228 [Aphanomyces euteiches]|uniref:Uncharacterized protein n=1 Tax=Aphanomyces euteiches TaxID=100861 RepID=A0A6G0WZ80_9STRA|nr:hypothetical protein Ae201684_010228 [Aphanomyces euteiches]
MLALLAETSMVAAQQMHAKAKAKVVTFTTATTHTFHVGWSASAMPSDYVPGVGLTGKPICKNTQRVHDAVGQAIASKRWPNSAWNKTKSASQDASPHLNTSTSFTRGSDTTLRNDRPSTTKTNGLPSDPATASRELRKLFGGFKSVPISPWRHIAMLLTLAPHLGQLAAQWRRPQWSMPLA